MTFAAAACLLATGCSPGADAPPYPSIFPSAHDEPAARTDTPMNSVEVQKATEDLITEGDRLNAQASPSQGPTTGQAPARGTAGPKIASKRAPAAKSKSKASRSAPQQTAAVPPATTASAQGAGMQAAGSDPKP